MSMKDSENAGNERPGNESRAKERPGKEGKEGNETRKHEMICGLTADERVALSRGLAALPDTMPPRVVWHRIREQAAAEGLFRRPLPSRRAYAFAGTGIAAAIALMAILLPRLAGTPGVEFSAVPDNVVVSNPPVNTLQSLMVESQQLEDDLRALPAEPRVLVAGTQATILELEDRIAAIDYQLSDPQARLSDADREVFWRERVRLMKSLVQLRYAQTQRAAF